MQIIYTPKGSAREYAELGLNLYNGCTHRCRYCYCAHTRYADKEKYFAAPAPKKNILPRVTADCQALLKKYSSPDAVPEILLSFQGDCYQPAEMCLALTRKVIEILIDHNLRFTILTKGGTRVCRDFDLLAPYAKFRLGVSLSLLAPTWVKMYEPAAPDPADRMVLLRRAKDKGITTWVSLEPVIDPLQAMMVIRECSGAADHWKVGRISHMPGADRQDWQIIRKDIEGYLIDMKADYIIKQSMTEGA